MTFHVCCVRAGTAFAPEYVEILHDSIRRNLAGGVAGDFTVFTDQPDQLADGIIVRPLPADLPGWWSKLALFRPGLFPDGDRVLYFDLGCVITGRLDEIAAYGGPFAILRDFYRPDGLQSAVMAWEAGQTDAIWQSFDNFGCPMDDEGGDQAWIERVSPDAAILQDKFPGLFVSYKADNLDKNPPDKASVVVFHGKPKPAEIGNGWVPEVWRVGGMTRAELDTVLNVQREAMLDQVRDSMKRGLLWLDTVTEHEGHVCIVGGGPSLVDKLDELRWRDSLGQQVWALNGAARFLLDHGMIADMVVIADARPENARFLDGLHPSTIACLASQCHPDVFDKALKDRRGVYLWHVNTEGMVDLLKDERKKPVHLIGGGSTVGLNAMVIAFAKGYRKIHLFGFDSSLSEDQHHAYSQPQNDGDRIVDALYNGRKYKTTAWMAQQVNEFQDLVPGLVNDGCIITVAGEGLLPTVARDIVVGPSPAEIRANEVLKRLNGAANPHGVEVGVFAGDMSAALLKGNPHLHLDMVDSWEGDGAAYQGDSGDFHAGLSQGMQDEFMRQAAERVRFAGKRAMILKNRSAEAADAIPDGSRDFVFLDADHSYEGCMADLRAWASKVKPGGWLCGHDYENRTMPKFGVTQAVNEFVTERGLTLELGENCCWFAKV